MGDYSSTIKFVNKLDTSFSFNKSDISVISGYLLRNGGDIPSNSTSGDYQIKDKVAGSTEATLKFRASDKLRTSFEVAVACPYALFSKPPNRVTIKSYIPGVMITAGEWSASAHPLMVTFTIEKDPAVRLEDIPSSLPSIFDPISLTFTPLSNWSDFIRDSIDPSERLDIDAWTISSVSHRKCFHFSPVSHEYLQLHIASAHSAPEAVTTIQVERTVEEDRATAGWHWTQPPELQGWWVKRLLRGDYNPSLKNRMALNYSASDFLCSLTFPDGMSLRDFATITHDFLATAPKYHAVDANCYGFADGVYQKMKEGRAFEEKKGQYYEHMGKFALLDFSSWNIPFISGGNE